MAKMDREMPPEWWGDSCGSLENRGEWMEEFNYSQSVLTHVLVVRMMVYMKTAEKIILMRVLPKQMEGALATGIWAR